VVNNPDRVHDLTAEPIKASPPDAEKCHSTGAANFTVWFPIDAAGAAGCACRLGLNPKKSPGIHINENPPKDHLGGKRKPVFWGVCRVSEVGVTVRGFPTDDAWSFGLRRRTDPTPANGGLEEDQYVF
jgi:hypothetical protein